MKKERRKQIHNAVAGGLRETIRVHGPITRDLISSAVKRIVGALLAREKKD